MDIFLRIKQKQEPFLMVLYNVYKWLTQWASFILAFQFL